MSSHWAGSASWSKSQATIALSPCHTAAWSAVPRQWKPGGLAFTSAPRDSSTSAQACQPFCAAITKALSSRSWVASALSAGTVSANGERMGPAVGRSSPSSK